jgi:hypothetical protein
LRHLPVGQIEKDTPEFKEFRKTALEHDFLIRLVDNPKTPGSASFQRYQRYQLASSLRELIELSATSSNPVERRSQVKKAHEDIKNDCLRGFIHFPQHEHTASAHFVDAAKLARQHNVTSIHALYSSEEMSSARAAMLADLEAFATFAAEAHDAPVDSLTFHDQVRSLWDYDRSLQLNESELRQESAFAAATVQDLLSGGSSEPASFRHVAKHPDRDQWLASMARERSTLEERGTWILVPRSSIGAHRPVKCKYVYRLKLLKDNSWQYKSRLVACGYSQVAGLDYSIDETYAGVASYSSVHLTFVKRAFSCPKLTFRVPTSRATYETPFIWSYPPTCAALMVAHSVTNMAVSSSACLNVACTASSRAASCGVSV